MAIRIPPPPIQEEELGTSWKNWFLRVKDILTKTGAIAWASLDFTNSKISDIIDRNHNDLISIQGGTSNEYYHLSSTELTKLTNIPISSLEELQDTIGDMVSGNVETGISVTYDDVDGKLDFAVSYDTTTDVIIDNSAKGVVLKDTANHYWRITVDTSGALVTTDLGTTKP